MIALKDHPAPPRSLESHPAFAQRAGRRAENPSILHGAQPPDMDGQPACRIKNILVPTDFSACSAQAVALAASMARKHDALLTLLHVVDINAPASWTHLGTAESLMLELWTTGGCELRYLAEGLTKSQTNIQTLIVEGLPVETIVERSSGFDLLVIGEERRKRGRSIFSKDTARRVIERAECPVLVVHQKTGVGRRALEVEANAGV